MSRFLICTGVALLLALGSTAWGEEPVKKGETVKGAIKKVDPSAHKLTIVLDSKKVPPDREFEILDSTLFIFTAADGEKKEVRGKAAYKDKRLAEAAPVTVLTDAKGKLTEVRVGKVPPRKTK